MSVTSLRLDLDGAADGCVLPLSPPVDVAGAPDCSWAYKAVGVYWLFLSFDISYVCGAFSTCGISALLTLVDAKRLQTCCKTY